MKVLLELTQNEVYEQIPYEVVCETMYGSRWETMRRRRYMKEWFNDAEVEKIRKLKQQAYRWMCVTGVPNGGVKMHMSTYKLWQKLGEFCACL